MNVITVKMENLSEEERKQLIELVEKSNKENNKVWKPADREKYYYIRNDGEVYHGFYEKYCSADCGNYSMGNCFRTREEAEFAAEKLKVSAELKRFAKENNEEIDWNKQTQLKYHLFYNHRDKEIVIDYNTVYQFNSINFSSVKIAKQAVNTIGEERLKKYYFEVVE